MTGLASLRTIAIIVFASLFLASCGGGSSGGNTVAQVIPNDDQTPDPQEPDTTPDTNDDNEQDDPKNVVPVFSLSPGNSANSAYVEGTVGSNILISTQMVVSETKTVMVDIIPLLKNKF